VTKDDYRRRDQLPWWFDLSSFLIEIIIEQHSEQLVQEGYLFALHPTTSLFHLSKHEQIPLLAFAAIHTSSDQ
jgi:hypothetical protein